MKVLQSYLLVKLLGASTKLVLQKSISSMYSTVVDTYTSYNYNLITVNLQYNTVHRATNRTTSNRLRYLGGYYQYILSVSCYTFLLGLKLHVMRCVKVRTSCDIPQWCHSDTTGLALY